MKKITQYVLKKIGMDLDVSSTILLRFWTVIAGGITVLIIPIYLSPDQQGYYFTFYSIIAIQIFFELGLNHVLVQLTAHSAAHLRRMPHEKFEGDNKWKLKIYHLILLSRNWNAVMASIYLFALLIGGGYFFYRNSILAIEEWVYIWAVLAIASAGNFFISGRLAICEGLGEVARVAILRFRLSLIGYTLMWLMLISGYELWSMVMPPVLNSLGSIFWLKARNVIKEFKVSEVSSVQFGGGISYFTDVFPLQWRIAISWISGYFIFNLITPVVFSHLGAIEAGKIGVALIVFSAISSIGMSWVSAKIPEFSRLIAINDRMSLNKLFFKQAYGSFLITLLILIFAITSKEVVGHYIGVINERFPSLDILLILAASTAANVLIFTMAVYVRAHKEEPLLVMSCVHAILTTFGMYIVVGLGLKPTVLIYSSTTLCISLPWCALIFRKYWKKDL